MFLKTGAFVFYVIASIFLVISLMYPNVESMAHGVGFAIFGVILEIVERAIRRS